MRFAPLAPLLLCAIASWTFAQAATQPAATTQPAPPAQPTAPAPKPDTNQRLRQLFADLAHHDGDTREQARTQLMGMTRLELSLFRHVVADSRPLRPAQALALREIVMQAHLAHDSYPADHDIGFLGVQLGNTTMDEDEGQAEGVLVTGRIIGFCGYRMLRTGDIILRVVEQPNVPLRSHAHLAALIRTFPAGATVRLEVLRQGQLIQIPLRLDARPLELRESGDLDNFQWRRNERFHAYWTRHFAPLLGEGVS